MKTAVEWLIEELWQAKKTKSNWKKIEDKAKEIEKEQIIKAFNEGTFAQDEKITAEEYYNEIFK